MSASPRRIFLRKRDDQIRARLYDIVAQSRPRTPAVLPSLSFVAQTRLELLQLFRTASITAHRMQRSMEQSLDMESEGEESIVA